ncbi:4'-phosphopantetheinyl transferase family protein [Edwardsiella anguillarum]|uniref:4'-phosphopantetheinyl transferase family protein n=1 Tax=Edwardsiella anguillarum TaxID=1821960 RepID=UPI0024B7C210|nr:4'-phosphopantetheinyl transferase superfamily protein [Edwardsiella anguillarum]WHP78925.1 4'-phosphopantetheinyl transferase superfamily protein [Edwardsiella anguillarum]WHQ16331.1 4'-phosphopantetheinyl transferase superfamily protein [Edwardsiella anguillarum]WHQ19864.1 4'-phosphopantetheinyl transferase superfamily protein [Edwardsiella anguillarum]WHQ23387.1 4'-phosphopantetheinyl transferase superfamily protein [Edwardsiella anguillarum]WHQ26960.1 4'-phosphopantetheinyl transferase 
MHSSAKSIAPRLSRDGAAQRGDAGFIQGVTWLAFPGYPGRIGACRFSLSRYRDEGEYQGIVLPPPLRHAAPKRQAEFIAGRWVARQVMAVLGVRDGVIARGSDHAPQWPPGIAGSISHSAGMALCAAHPTSRRGGVGIDVEAWLAPSRARAVQPAIASSHELADLRARAPDFSRLITLIFSAKESLFKALYPEVNRWFDFHDAQLTAIDWRQQTFQLTLLTPLAPDYPAGRCFLGQFQADDEAIVTLIYC